MNKIILISSIIVSICVCGIIASLTGLYNITSGDTLKKIIEEAYFEGQKDAITGDVRIRKNNDGCWIWTKSCWDSGRKTSFNPNK